MYGYKSARATEGRCSTNIQKPLVTGGDGGDLAGMGALSKSGVCRLLWVSMPLLPTGREAKNI